MGRGEGRESESHKRKEEERVKCIGKCELSDVE
jgi:hypothetical protein